MLVQYVRDSKNRRIGCVVSTKKGFVGWSAVHVGLDKFDNKLALKIAMGHSEVNQLTQCNGEVVAFRPNRDIWGNLTTRVLQGIDVATLKVVDNEQLRRPLKHMKKMRAAIESMYRRSLVYFKPDYVPASNSQQDLPQDESTCEYARPYVDNFDGGREPF